MPMDKTKILALADAIEQDELSKRGIGFNMRFFAPEEAPRWGCETACCIAGWSAVLRGAHTAENPFVSPSGEGVWLGLDGAQQDELFSPSQVETYEDLTRAHAVAVLRHLAETGEVDWERFAGLSPEAVFTEEMTEESDDAE